jgi:DNA-binding MarR family transcriptional regulator
VDQALSPTSVAIDDLIADLNLAPALVAMVILELELAGLAERHPGNRISRLAPEPITPSQDQKISEKPRPSRNTQSELF